MAKIKQDLGQLFENNSNCYADTEDDSVIMAIDKEMFVKVVTDLLTECVVEKADTGKRQLTIFDVSNRRELLIAFREWINEDEEMHLYIPERHVDRFIDGNL